MWSTAKHLMKLAFVLMGWSSICLSQELVLTDVPGGYLWTHGCSPTSGMVLFGYWDNYGFPNLIPGSSNWATNDEAIQEAIATSGDGRYSSTGTIYELGTPGTGHVPDYALYDGQNDETWIFNCYEDLSELDPETAHADNCLADFMRTSRSSHGNVYGATQPGDVSTGMSSYAAYRGYSFDASHEGILFLSWNKLKHEIDYGRPVLVSVDMNGDLVRDHTVTGIGYRYLDGKPQFAFLDSGTSWQWHDFEQAFPLVQYGVLDLDCVRPAGTHDTEWTPLAGWWDDTPNWDGGLPDSTAFAYIPENTTAMVNEEATAYFIHNVGNIHMDGGTLNAAQVRNVGALIGNGSVWADVKNFGQFGAVLGDLTFSGVLSNYERVLIRPGHSLQLEPSSMLMNLEPGSIRQEGDSVVTMNGQMVQKYSNWMYYWEPAPAVIDNHEGAVYDLLGDGSILLATGSSSENWIDNAGLFRKSGGTGESAIEAAFNNKGSLEVDSGVLALKGGGQFTNATTFVENGASLRLASTMTVSADSTFNGSGSVDLVTGGQLDIGDGVTIHGSGPIVVNGGGLCGAGLNSAFGSDTDVHFQSGSLQGNGITVTGSFSWIGGPGDEKRLAPSSTVANMGTMRQVGDSSVTMCGFTLAPWGPWPASIDNRQGGTYDLFGDGDILLGTVETRDGPVHASPAYNVISNQGTFRKSSGAGESVVEASFNNRGLLDVQSGTLTLKGGGQFTDSEVAIDEGANLQLESSFTVSGRNTFGGLGVVQVGAAGSLGLQSGAAVHGGAPVFVNGGLLAGSGQDSFFVWDTHLSLLSGTVEGVAVSGSFDWAGGTVAGDFLNAGNSMAVEGIAEKRISPSTTLTNTGTIHQRGDASIAMCGFTLSPWGPWPALVDNKQTGVYDLSGDGDILLGTVETRDGPVHASPGYNVISNQGTFRKSAGTGESVIQPTFNNRGTVEVDSGTLAFQGGFTQATGSVYLNGGNVSSMTPLSVMGGSIQGSGTILADILNQGGTVSPGFSPGLLTIDGDYIQGPDATLLLEIAGLGWGDYDIFNVTGTATLGGYLEIDFLNDFRPTLGDTLDIFTYGSCVGQFDSIYARGFPDYSFIPTYGLSGLALEIGDVPSAIPLPSSLCLAIVGILAVRRWARRDE